MQQLIITPTAHGIVRRIGQRVMDSSLD